MVLKVDFERAYDCVRWDCLRFLLRKMNFGNKRLKWMEALVFNGSMPVLVNGSETKDLEVGKRFRQGDPLSPFIFIIVRDDYVLNANRFPLVLFFD